MGASDRDRVSMVPDPDDEALAEQLFEAARRERPMPGVKQQTLRVAAAAKPWLPKERWLLVALTLGALGALFALGQHFDRPELGQAAGLGSIRPEPLQVSSRSVAVVPGKVDARPPVTAAPTSSAARIAVVPSNRVSAARPAPKAPAASLEQELEMLDRVRQALLGGDTTTALARLTQYDQTATRRHLGAEATLLRIQVLAASGRASEASALASEFVAKHPNSPLVDRAKSFVQLPPRGDIKEGVGP